MTDIRIVRDYPYPPELVWRAVTDPALIPRWTATGRGGRPAGFSATVGTRFRFVGRSLPGWDGVVYCEVVAARAPELLRYTWAESESGAPTYVTYRLEATADGTRFSYDHTGFTGLGGLLLARLVLGPVRRKMLDVGLPPVLASLSVLAGESAADGRGVDEQGDGDGGGEQDGGAPDHGHGEAVHGAGRDARGGVGG